MTNQNDVLCETGSSTVTRTLLRTRRQTIALGDVDHVELRRPFAGLAATIGIGSFVLPAHFKEELLLEEGVALQSIGLMVIVAALLIGRLKVHSLSLKDQFLFGPYWRLWRMRQAIDRVIAERVRNGDNIQVRSEVAS